MTQLTGHSIVAGAPLAGTAGTFAGQDPATAQALEPAYSLLDEAQVAQATAAAQEAFASFSALAPEPHARFLEQVDAVLVCASRAHGADVADREGQCQTQ